MTNRNHRALWAATLTALLALVITAPAAANAEVTEQFHRTVPLAADGRVSLDNINGNVEITGWDRNEVQIDAVKTARDQQRLQEARIDVDVSGNSVRIKTHYPDNHTNNNPASVAYQLHVPRNARLDEINLVNGSLNVQKVGGEINAKLVNGKLTARDLSGRAELSTVNGSIEANYASLNDVHNVKLSSVNGSINLMLPQSSSAHVEANTVSGGIHTDFPLQVKGGFVGKSLDGDLGSGGPSIELNNVNGSISIAPGKSGL
jgi:DUF4097 and DUF4098 domain-containing protein YvlB